MKVLFDQGVLCIGQVLVFNSKPPLLGACMGICSLTVFFVPTVCKKPQTLCFNADKPHLVNAI